MRSQLLTDSGPAIEVFVQAYRFVINLLMAEEHKRSVEKSNLSTGKRIDNEIGSTKDASFERDAEDEPEVHAKRNECSTGDSGYVSFTQAEQQPIPRTALLPQSRQQQEKEDPKGSQ